jgi:hypothetical protein
MIRRNNLERLSASANGEKKDGNYEKCLFNSGGWRSALAGRVRVGSEGHSH